MFQRPADPVAQGFTAAAQSEAGSVPCYRTLLRQLDGALPDVYKCLVSWARDAEQIPDSETIEFLAKGKWQVADQSRPRDEVYYALDIRPPAKADNNLSYGIAA